MKKHAFIKEEMHKKKNRQIWERFDFCSLSALAKVSKSRVFKGNTNASKTVHIFASATEPRLDDRKKSSNWVCTKSLLPKTWGKYIWKFAQIGTRRCVFAVAHRSDSSRVAHLAFLCSLARTLFKPCFRKNKDFRTLPVSITKSNPLSGYIFCHTQSSPGGIVWWVLLVLLQFWWSKIMCQCLTQLRSGHA